MDYKQNVKDSVGGLVHVPYVEFQVCMALELGACRCACMATWWAAGYVRWIVWHSIEPRQDETYGADSADSGFVETVDVRRQAWPWEFGCSACVVWATGKKKKNKKKEGKRPRIHRLDSNLGSGAAPGWAARRRRRQRGREEKNLIYYTSYFPN